MEDLSGDELQDSAKKLTAEVQVEDNCRVCIRNDRDVNQGSDRGNREGFKGENGRK